jgi:hypothetical protein
LTNGFLNNKNYTAEPRPFELAGKKMQLDGFLKKSNQLSKSAFNPHRMAGKKLLTDRSYENHENLLAFMGSYNKRPFIQQDELLAANIEYAYFGWKPLEEDDGPLGNEKQQPQQQPQPRKRSRGRCICSRYSAILLLHNLFTSFWYWLLTYAYSSRGLPIKFRGCGAPFCDT